MLPPAAAELGNTDGCRPELSRVPGFPMESGVRSSGSVTEAEKRALATDARPLTPDTGCPIRVATRESGLK